MNPLLDRPELVVRVLREVANRELPWGDLVVLPPADDQQAVFAIGNPRDPRHIVLTAFQHVASANVHRQIARDAAALWLDYGCRVTVLVICPDQQTAEFYAQPLVTGLEDYVLHAVALTADQVPPQSRPAPAAHRSERLHRRGRLPRGPTAR
jgi:hypothetical protein